MTEAQSVEKTDEVRAGRLRWLAAAAFAVLYLLVLSATSVPTVFPSDRPARLAGPDAYFHLRHAEAALANFPHLLRPDPMTNFPHGEVGINQGFFDLSVAGVSKLSLGLLSPKAILIVISPLCALLAMLWSASWLSREVGDACAGCFLLFSLAYPASLSTVAALGQGDHHVFELLMAVAIAWSLSWLFRPSTSWKMAPVAALPLLWLYFSWAGSPLQLLLVGIVFYFRAWNPEISDDRLAAKGSLFGLTLLLVVAAMNAIAPWTTLWSVCYQVFMLGGALLFLGYPILVRLAARFRRFPTLGAIVVLASGFLPALWYPKTRALLLSLGEERSSAISEHAQVSLGLLNVWFGPLWVLAILGLLLLFWRRKLWWASTPLIYAGGLVAFWLLTKDFVYYSSAPIAAAAAYALTAWKWPRSLPVAALLLASIPLIPGSGVRPPWMPPSLAQETMLVTDGLESASAWLRQVHESRDKGDTYGLVAPWDLGNILAQTTAIPVGWSQTHSELLAKILYSDRPETAYKVLTEGTKPFRYIYLPARNLSEKYITELEIAGIPTGAEFTGDQSQWKGQPITLLKTLPRHDRALLNRLYWKRGKDLGHYRLVYETAEQSLHSQKLYPERNSVELFSRPVTPDSLKLLKPLLDFPHVPLETNQGIMVKARLAPEVRIFEIVAGAKVTGTGPADTLVTAELDLHSPTSGKTWSTSWSTRVDSRGKWSLRLPYPTDSPISEIPGTVEVHGKYRLRVGKKDLTFSLSEPMIRNGSSLVVGAQKKL